MVQKCSRCVRLSLVCKVHTASGRCGECVRSNCSDCDVQFTHAEWKSLTKEHDKVVTQMGQAHAARLRAQNKLEALAKELRVAQHEWDTARAKEQRLVLQEDLLKKRASEAIAVESASLATFDPPVPSSLPETMSVRGWMSEDPPDFAVFSLENPPSFSWSQFENTVGPLDDLFPVESRDQETAVQ